MFKELIIHKDDKPCYPIILSEDFSHLGAALEKLDLTGRKVCIVTDSNVAPLYLAPVRAAADALAGSVTDFIFEAGEARKNLETVEALYEHLIKNRFERGDFLMALGGGVVGDLTGYAAASYLRGIRFIQIPTTLLAQVDSSIGGKTGVDFKSYKNMIGAFHQPVLVYSASHTLKSLSDRIYAEGMGEILKHGMICDQAYLGWLKVHREAILNRDPGVILEMVLRSDRIKQQVVEADPYEQGLRAILNFGHTLGHAVEKLSGFDLLHGECVSIGICGALYLSEWRGHLEQSDCQQMIGLLKDFGLPVSACGLSPEEIAVTTKSDKKMDRGSVRFILLQSIGSALICHDVGDDELLAVAKSICQS